MQNQQLKVRKFINALPEKIFDAWIQPEQLKKWWGPEGIECSDAKFDLQQGGKYHINNQLPDGKEILIYGEFLTIDRPNKLTFTWKTDPGTNDTGLVTVRFIAKSNGTEVIINHKKITSDEAFKSHKHGWIGCLEGLNSYFQN